MKAKVDRRRTEDTCNTTLWHSSPPWPEVSVFWRRSRLPHRRCMSQTATERHWHGRRSAWQVSVQVRTRTRDRKAGCRRQGLTLSGQGLRVAANGSLLEGSATVPLFGGLLWTDR